MAVRRGKKSSYTFAQLSDEAKDVAIKKYRDRHYDRLFDDVDAHGLTELFQEDLLNHYGLGDLKVYWTLGHTQGDGVCFEGRVDLETFIKAEKKEKEFGPLIGLVYAKIKHDGRYCHWNSMTIEVEIDGSVTPVDLLPESLRLEYEDWNAEHRSRERQRMEVEHRRTQPIRDWQAQVNRWREIMERKYHTKQDWTPRVPEPPIQPQPLDIPMPPAILIPADLKAALSAAAREFERLEKTVGEFEEYLTGRIQEISRELEKMGYDEIEHHHSDEYIADRLSDDDEEYNEDGTLKDED